MNHVPYIRHCISRGIWLGLQAVAYTISLGWCTFGVFSSFAHDLRKEIPQEKQGILERTNKRKGKRKVIQPPSTWVVANCRNSSIWRMEKFLIKFSILLVIGMDTTCTLISNCNIVAHNKLHTFGFIQNIATRCNWVAKRKKHVVHTKAAILCVEMLRVFDRAFIHVPIARFCNGSWDRLFNNKTDNR